MRVRTPWLAAAAVAALAAGCSMPVAQRSPMSFFVTSTGVGNGADLGGLAGADAHCAKLAGAVGAGGRAWRAYLSTTGPGGVDARERIGRGPWRNAKGEVIASSVDELHGRNNLTKQTALSEKGEVINGRGDTPNRHDILTGSTPEGRAIPGEADTTCGNWTKSGADGAAMLGHSDRTGLDESDAAKSWNSSHLSRGGCSQQALRGTGGDGLLYCFASD